VLDLLAQGRAVAAVLAVMLPLGARVDECALVAAPDDEDWDADYVDMRGGVVGLRLVFDDDGQLLSASLRPRDPLPADPHGTDAPEELARPVVDRDLLVLAGGPTRLWNQHVTSPDQRHALDLVGFRFDEGRPGTYGGSAGTRNEDHAIWDAPVVSPASGVVVRADDGVPDHDKPHVEWRDDAHPFGNVVVLKLDGAERWLVLGHLRRGSVVVKRGERVRAGDPIGHVGNSGNSSEPHLHMHVQDRPELKRGFGVPIVVDGAPWLRGQLKKRPASSR
jgi:hypothetical protein